MQKGLHLHAHGFMLASTWCGTGVRQRPAGRALARVRHTRGADGYRTPRADSGTAMPRVRRLGQTTPTAMGT